MPRKINNNRGQDMYWFAHGGVDTSLEHPVMRESAEAEEDTSEFSSSSHKSQHSTNSEDNSLSKSVASDRPDSGNRTTTSTLQSAIEGGCKQQTFKTEQEKNDSMIKKALEREAVLEARRNAQRSTTSFAFGSNGPAGGEFDIAPVRLQPISNHVNHVPSKSVLVANNNNSINLMSQSMTASMCVTSTRGRGKNDLTPAIPYERSGNQQRSTTGAIRKRSVSMSRLDFLAKPRKHYVEAQKANSSISNSSSVQKEASQSPKRPLSSASDKSKMGHSSSTVTVTRRSETGSRKPRPVSIAGNVPDKTPQSSRTSTPLRKTSLPRRPEKPSLVSSKEALKTSSGKPAPPPKPTIEKKQVTATSKTPTSKPTPKTTPSKPKISTPKSSPSRKITNKKPATATVAPTTITTEAEGSKKADAEPSKADDLSIGADDDSHSTEDKSSAKHIISEEEAKAALAEKRRLAREQAERDALIQQQQEEELRKAQELAILQEEERQRKMEEEQLRLLEEHKRFEEEKLQKAIEEHERLDAEEKAKREEETRLKLEQDRKAKEEAEKQRIELEEKLRKEEEERAERKKRLDKIMSRTRGGGGSKSGTASPCGSLNGSEPLDSIENQPLSSEPSSLDSIEQLQHMDHPNDSKSYEMEEALDLASHSLSSNDLMLPSSERTSLDASITAFPSEPTSLEGLKEEESQKQPCDVDENPFAQQDVLQQQEDLSSMMPSQSETSVDESTLKANEQLLEIVDNVTKAAVKRAQDIAENTCDSDQCDNKFNCQKDDTPHMLPNFSFKQGDSDYIDNCITVETKEETTINPVTVPPQNDSNHISESPALKNAADDGSQKIDQITPALIDSSMAAGIQDTLPSTSIIPDSSDKFDILSDDTGAILSTGHFSEHPDNLLDMDTCEIGKSTVVLERANGDFVIEHNPEDASSYGNPFLVSDLNNHQSPIQGFANTMSGNPFSTDLQQSSDFQTNPEFSTSLNPFGAVEYQDGGVVNNPQRLPSRNGLRSAIDFIPEESEDSSLDSNLSQVMNVNSNYAGFSEETSSIASDGVYNGQSQPNSATSSRETNNQHMVEGSPQSKRCNGNSHDGSLSSAPHKADQPSDLSSEKMHLPNTNGTAGSPCMFLEDKDILGSTKTVSNPFMGDNESNLFTSNPF